MSRTGLAMISNPNLVDGARGDGRRGLHLTGHGFLSGTSFGFFAGVGGRDRAVEGKAFGWGPV